MANSNKSIPNGKASSVPANHSLDVKKGYRPHPSNVGGTTPPTSGSSVVSGSVLPPSQK